MLQTSNHADNAYKPHNVWWQSNATNHVTLPSNGVRACFSALRLAYFDTSRFVDEWESHLFPSISLCASCDNGRHDA